MRRATCSCATSHRRRGSLGRGRPASRVARGAARASLGGRVLGLTWRRSSRVRRRRSGRALSLFPEIAARASARRLVDRLKLSHSPLPPRLGPAGWRSLWGCALRFWGRLPAAALAGRAVRAGAFAAGAGRAWRLRRRVRRRRSPIFSTALSGWPDRQALSCLAGCWARALSSSAAAGAPVPSLVSALACRRLGPAAFPGRAALRLSRASARACGGVALVVPRGPAARLGSWPARRPRCALPRRRRSAGALCVARISGGSAQMRKTIRPCSRSAAEAPDRLGPGGALAGRARAAVALPRRRLSCSRRPRGRARGAGGWGLAR